MQTKTDELLLVRFADIMINHMFMMPVYSLGLVVCVKLGCTTGGIRQAVAVVHGAIAAFPNIVIGGGNFHTGTIRKRIVILIKHVIGEAIGRITAV